MKYVRHVTSRSRGCILRESSRIFIFACEKGAQIMSTSSLKKLNSVTKSKGSNKKMISINDVRMLLDHLGISVAYNVMTAQIEITGMPRKLSGQNANNTLPIYLRNYMKKKFEQKVSKSEIEDAILYIADTNRYNPVIDMLVRTAWDGKDRIEELVQILGAENDEFSILLLKKYLHQSIALAFNDELNPFGADGILILKGDQGIGKSWLLKKLAVSSKLFGEGISLNTDNKDCVIQATSTWICELGELDSTLNRNQTQFKAFITNSVDVYRPPYGRREIHKPRRTSFCGTVNPDNFLKDNTGSRRFWIIPVESIDLKLLPYITPEWVKCLWRQVFEQLYLPNKQGFRLTDEEQKQLEQRNAQYYEILPGELELRENLNWTSERWDWYTCSEVRERMEILKRYRPEQLGKALSKIARQDTRINIKKPHNKKQYYIPCID